MDNIRTRRIAAGLSIADLAAQVGVTRSHLSYMERGKRSVTAAQLIRLADALGDTELADTIRAFVAPAETLRASVDTDGEA
jgi:transcriptional regulator with XRE-family HTH domain